MKLHQIAYKYGGEVRTIIMMVINWNGRFGPLGFEARPDLTMSTENRWVLDDEPTTIIHPIVDSTPLGTISRVVLDSRGTIDVGVER